VLFLSYWFVVFAAVFFGLYWLAPPRGRTALALAGSVVFHGHFAGPAGVAPVVVMGAATYFAGRSGRRGWCLAAITLVVGCLLAYKYCQFMLEGLLGLVAPESGRRAWESARGLLPAAPPLAISFFAFEFVHYLVEVLRGHPPIGSPREFATFAVYWPSIVAGPIKRYEQFLPQLEAGARALRRGDVATGALRVGLGVLKKFVADTLTVWISANTPGFATLPLASRWAFAVALALRIVLDFSGYSDMAIGFARMQGVRLPENFLWPYLARSPADFWRRWHVSLSSWIRDYVYIPLGGGRSGPARRMLNGLVAFALCGLWHGAAWNFVAWGVYHGVGLAVVTGVGNLGAPGLYLAAFFRRAWVLSWLLTMLFVGAGWFLFFHPLGQALEMLRLLVRES